MINNTELIHLVATVCMLVISLKSYYTSPFPLSLAAVIIISLLANLILYLAHKLYLKITKK